MEIKRLFQKERVWTYSNLLSISRLFLGFGIYYYILQRNTITALAFTLLAIFTDYADGYVARKRNEISELGKILDPVADKIAVALGTIALYKSFGLPMWIVIIIIGRDMLIIFGSIFLFGKVQSVAPSEMPGKIAVTVISILLLSYILEIEPLKNILLILTAVAVLSSLLFYMVKFFKIYN
jgi:CDP-diacylglycerol--glycerol-3-phosphate 3-phosphatidyltransferase